MPALYNSGFSFCDLKIDVKISKPPDDFRRFYRFKEIPAASEKVRLQITQPIFDILITMCYDLYIKLFMPVMIIVFRCNLNYIPFTVP